MRAEQIDATCNRNQFRHPVAARHRRIDPFDESQPRIFPPSDPRGDLRELRRHTRIELRARIPAAKRIGNALVVGIDVRDRVRACGYACRTQARIVLYS